MRRLGLFFPRASFSILSLFGWGIFSYHTITRHLKLIPLLCLHSQYIRKPLFTSVRKGEGCENSKSLTSQSIGVSFILAIQNSSKPVEWNSVFQALFTQMFLFWKFIIIDGVLITDKRILRPLECKHIQVPGRNYTFERTQTQYRVDSLCSIKYVVVKTG